jgi:hypothetical protein
MGPGKWAPLAPWLAPENGPQKRGPGETRGQKWAPLAPLEWLAHGWPMAPWLAPLEWIPKPGPLWPLWIVSPMAGPSGPMAGL